MQSFFNQETAIIFFLVLARVAGVIVASPVLSSNSVPSRFKVMIALVITLMLFPTLHPEVEIPSTIAAFLTAIAGQIAIGLLVGIAISIMFAALQTVGAFIDLEIGFGMSMMMDPSSGIQTTIIAKWYYFLAIMLFLGLNGHQWLMLGLVNSFKIIPLTTFTLSNGLTEYLVRSFSDIFRIAFNAAAPVFIAILMVDVTAGFIAKTAPKIDILFLTIPFKIALGMFVMMISFPILIYMFTTWLSSLRDPILKLFYV